MYEQQQEVRAPAGATGSGVIRVGIADDHPIVRRALRCYLETLPDMQVVGEAASGREAIDLVRTHATDVLLLDVHMPGQSGIDALSMIRAKSMRENLGVLMLSTSPEHLYALPLLRSGASGYLNKCCALEEIAAAVRRVAGGHRWISPLVAELLAEKAFASATDETHDQLSQRELQVLMKLARGGTTADAASELSLSPKTVTAVRAGLMRKLEARSNTDLTYYALKHRLVR